MKHIWLLGVLPWKLGKLLAVDKHICGTGVWGWRLFFPGFSKGRAGVFSTCVSRLEFSMGQIFC